MRGTDWNSPHPAGCACGMTAFGCDSPEATASAALRVAAEQAAFGRHGRRRMIQAIGAATFAAAFDPVFDLSGAQDAWARSPKASPEKKDLKVGFIAITCATPFIMAAPVGFYARNGLNVEVARTAGWAVIRDKSINGEYDAAHMLSPMPLALSMGVGANPTPWRVAAIENINGQAINSLPRPRDRKTIHHSQGHAALRNHIVDFLVTRSRTLAVSRPEGWDGRHVPEVRPAHATFEETAA